MEFFNNERKKWAARYETSTSASHPGLPTFDAQTRELFEKALPRGVMLPRLKADRERENYWMSVHELARHRFVNGQLIIGKISKTFLGHLDDRPMVTIAGARAGKTSTVLEPNLYLYPGSMLVLDPKEELAQAARFRRAMGHDVFVLKPFGESGEPTACFNPLDELDLSSPTLVDDVAAITNALVLDDGDGRSQHWNDSARTLLKGLILLTLSFPAKQRHLITVRELLSLSYGPLVEAVKRATAEARASGELNEDFFNRSGLSANALFREMVKLGGMFGGVAAEIGNRFLQTPANERGSIFSTAAVNTDFLDSAPLRDTLRRSDFRLSQLRGATRPTSIFLCLPVGRMISHARWLRLIVQLACMALERKGPYPRDKPPILFMMEEFATLGHMEIMERAAAYFPGFGVKLWVVLQDVTQLQRYYKNGWETFLGNAGLLQFFANGDEETLRYVASRLERLIAPFEIRKAFSRQRFSQLLLMEGLPPAAAMRLDHADVAEFRRNANKAFQSRLLLPKP